MSDLRRSILNATKWSSLTEVLARLVGLGTSMALARLLAPEAFGAVATIMLVISFAELFTDAGFQKYIIQHEFSSEEQRRESTDVAFWTNLALSLLLWGVIIVFREPIASLAGSPGLGKGIAVACVSIPLAAFSSIQMASFKRDFDFRSLFIVRMVSTLIPLFVTIPLALILRSYWALVAGTVLQNLSNAVLLTVFSSWKPRLRYSIARLREMLSFTVWTIFESVSIWITVYADIFIVGACLNQHLLGVYKTSMTVVGQFTGLITAATTPVLFSGLSRLQNDDDALKALFLKFQKSVAVLMVPLGVGLWCYRSFVTGVMLGSQWGEAAGFIGIWGIMSAATILLSQYCSEIYRAKGRPKLSVLAQWLHIVVLVPVLLIFVKKDFETLYWARSLVRLEMIAVNMLLVWRLVRLSPMEMIRNILPEAFACVFMAYAATFLREVRDSVPWNFLSVAVCACVYFTALTIFPYERGLVRKYLGIAGKKALSALRRLTRALSPVLSDSLYLRMMFLAKMGRRLHLRNPQTFSEKMQWMKIHLRDPRMTQMVDKAAAKDYIAARIGSRYVNPTLATWQRAEDIDFSVLPEKFVLKTTHDCGGMVICRDRNALDEASARCVMRDALSRRFYGENREWPYRDVVPKIIAEPYLEDEFGELRDYKFFCFNGNPELMFVASDRSKKDEETKFDFFDMAGRHLDLVNGHPNASVPPSLPEGFAKMQELAASLSEGWPFLRVDFYQAAGRIYVGELTFFHWSGWVPYKPEAWDVKLGKLLELPR